MDNRKVIYLDDAIDLLEELETKRLQGNVGLLYAPMIKGLKKLPPAEPEIIRCKDCNHRNRYRFPPQYEERDYCEKHEKVVREDGYCSWAERRQDDVH